VRNDPDERFRLQPLLVSVTLSNLSPPVLLDRGELIGDLPNDTLTKGHPRWILKSLDVAMDHLEHEPILEEADRHHDAQIGEFRPEQSIRSKVKAPVPVG